MKRPIVAGTSSLLAFIVIEIVFWTVDFNPFQNGTNFVYFLLSMGCFFGIFMLFYNGLTKLFVKD